MSSFEEENLYEMVDDLILDSESAPQPPLPPVCADQSPFLNGHHTKYYILQEIVESVANTAEVDVSRSVRKKLVDVGNINIMGQKKWLVKSLIEDGYNASLCHTYWPTTLNCPGGEYEYIDISFCDGGGRKQYCPGRIIVDIDHFKLQFEVARPTSKYKELCDILPSIFVGNEQKLRNIISIVCGEAKNSFRERGLHVPPWRTPCYMLSKWFSLSSTSAALIRSVNNNNIDDVFKFNVSSSSKVARNNYIGGVHHHQCGLSSQFSSMTATKCN